MKAADKQRDPIKWVTVGILLALGLTVNYYYAAQPLAIRLIGWLILAALVVLIAATTNAGRRFLVFAGQARIELYKVVWPSRQETVKSTVMVIIMVVIVAFLLWLLDTFLFWAISNITGI